MRDKIYRFMQGRYGTDDFYKFLFWVALIGIVINWFFKSQLLSFAVTLILVYAMYRVLIQKSQRPLCGKSEISAGNSKNPLLV